MGPEAVALLALLLAAPVDDPSGPWARWHFVYGKELEMSILFRRDAAGDETRLLVRCEAGRFEFTSHQDPSGRESHESIRSLEEGETFARTLWLPPSGADPRCGSLAASDACVVFEGPGASVRTGLSGFSGDGSAALRETCAALVSAGMRERLFALAPLLTCVAEFRTYTGDFLGLVWPGPFGRPSALRRGTRTRGCDVDAGFGHPCSSGERAREEARLGPDGVRSPGVAPPTRTPPRPPRG